MATLSKYNFTDKQIKFCREYIIDFNGTQAAIRAGYSKKTANEQSSKMLAKVNIQDFIKKLIQEQIKRTEITADKVVEEFAKVAFANSKDYYNKNNHLIAVPDLSDDKAAAIAEITFRKIPGGQEDEIKYRLHSKIQALDALAKHTGAYEKDNRQKSINITFDKEDENA